MSDSKQEMTLAQMAEALRAERDKLTAQVATQQEFLAGDYVGHAFHGNQWVGGEAGTAANKASQAAHEKSKSAEDAKSHHAAAKAHAEASKQQEIAGNGSAAAYHDAMSKYHNSEARHAENVSRKAPGSKASTSAEVLDEAFASIQTANASRDAALAELADAKAKLTGPQFDAAASAKATSTPPPANLGSSAAAQATPKTVAQLQQEYADLPNDPVLRAKWRKEHLKV